MTVCVHKFWYDITCQVFGEGETGMAKAGGGLWAVFLIWYEPRLQTNPPKLANIRTPPSSVINFRRQYHLRVSNIIIANPLINYLRLVSFENICLYSFVSLKNTLEDSGENLETLANWQTEITRQFTKVLKWPKINQLLKISHLTNSWTTGKYCSPEKIHAIKGKTVMHDEICPEDR